MGDRRLAALKRGELLSGASTDFMLELMGEARTGAMRMHAAVPAGWSLAHKTGTGPDWRGASVGINDVGLLTAPDGRTYAVAVMIRQTTRTPSARHAIMQNVVRAVEAAQNLEMHTIGLLGRDGGQLAGMCELAIVVPSGTTARIQEAHIMIGHTLCGMVEESLKLA